METVLKILENEGEHTDALLINYGEEMKPLEDMSKFSNGIEKFLEEDGHNLKSFLNKKDEQYSS